MNFTKNIIKIIKFKLSIIFFTIERLIRKLIIYFIAIIQLILKSFGAGKTAFQFFIKTMQSLKRKQAVFANYIPTKHDIFVCTYSKSGTNWMMQIAQQIIEYGEAEFDNIYDKIPFPDPLIINGVNLNDPRPQKQTPTGLRVIKTHFESDFVPYNSTSKYLIVLRNPVETLVSGYYFAHDNIGTNKIEYTVEEWLNLAQTPDYPFDSWASHTASYWHWKNRPNVLILTYGNMKRDLKKAVTQVASFLEVKLCESQLATIVYKSSYSYMKQHTTKFSPPFYFIGFKPEIVRKGETGKSEEILTPSQQATYIEFCKKELQRLQVVFPWEEIFP